MLSLIIFVLLLAWFLGYVRRITSFKGDYKETDAVIIRFVEDPPGPPDSVSHTPSYSPMIMYDNVYSGEKNFKKTLNNSGIAYSYIKTDEQRSALVGKKIRIQYTKNTERIVDKSLVPSNRYNLWHYLTPIIICCVAGIIGFLLLISSFTFLMTF